MLNMIKMDLYRMFRTKSMYVGMDHPGCVTTVYNISV